MKYISLTCILLFNYYLIFAQTPSHTAPTLQVGLDGLAFGKGTLDSELILEIISEKQSQIKLRVAQNILLKPLNDCGATIYSFGDNILKAVIEERDPVIRKRRILENTVNTLFSIGFTKYYIERIQNDRSERYKNQLAALTDIQNFIFRDTNLILHKTFITSGVNQENRNYKSKKLLYYYSTILDIASESIRRNKTFTDLGILNISYSKTFDYKSNFLNYQFKSTDNNEMIKSFTKSANVIFNGMHEELNLLTSLIGATKFLMDDKNMRTLAKSIDYQGYNLLNETIDFSVLKDQIKLISGLNINATHSEKINKIYSYLDKLENIDEFSENEYSDIIYTFTSDFIPTLEKVGLVNENNLKLISDFRSHAKYLLNKMIENEDLKSTLSYLSNEGNLAFFTNLLSRLYEFDRGSTYVEYFNLISEISEFLEQNPDFKNSEVKEKISYFNTFIKEYVVISEDQDGTEFIDFNVESFLAQLSEMPLNKPQKLSFLFDVGLSTGYFVKEEFELNNNTPIQNLSFISEKIGLRWKIYYPGFWRPRSPGETYRINGKNMIKTGVPKEPTINNIFLSIYGSGVLYNIFDISTESNFNSPFLGASLGLGFYNNLDVSISGAIPLVSDQSFSDSFNYPLVSLNFDFRFTEYIQRLGEKRKAAQNQKVIANAQK